jgi:parallel beta-helix repeat protein
MDSSNKTAVQFLLLNLPFELIERVIGHLHSTSLAHIYRTSHLLKELSNSAWLWRNRIQKEKQKIICVPADVTNWKRIFFKAIEFLTLQQAIKYMKDHWEKSKSLRRKLIFAPGQYLFSEPFLLLPNTDIQGLWDTPWDQKPYSQKTIFTCSKGSVIRSDGSGVSPANKISIQNITMETCSKTAKSGRVTCSLQNLTYSIENCEFFCKARSALHLVGASATIKNCNFHDSYIGLYCTRNSNVQAVGCTFTKNGNGLRAMSCKNKSIVIESCSFSENKNGIIFTASSATSIIKKCVIERSEERGIVLRPESECLLFENQISNSVVGLSVFHNTTIGLSNNIISNNIRHGVVIRYDANVDFITGNEIKNNGGTGLLMPEYCGETHFTREELVQNNKISENHTAIELYPKRPRYEMIYHTGTRRRRPVKTVNQQYHVAFAHLQPRT